MPSLTPYFLAALRYGGLQPPTLRALGEYQGKQQLYTAHSPEALAEETCPGISRGMVRLVLWAMNPQGLIASTESGRSVKWVHLGTGGVSDERHG